jgi:sugar phosphate isomerase/epimerase
MSLSRLPLSYCTNVHPGRAVAEVESGLDRYTAKIRDFFGKPLAAGLWLAEPVVTELLAEPDALVRFAGELARRGLTCHTLNAFPYGDFHSERVKEQVYLPDWSDPRRLRYTMQCAQVLAALLPANVDGSISTVPLGFKGFPHPADFHARCGDQLIECARQLNALHKKTGKRIRLAIEPEPLCELETTGEAIGFFQSLWKQADSAKALEAVREFLGVCFDVCHQAVEFEDVAESIASLDRAGVRLNKVHISCALQLDRPAENAVGREALRRYIEPRYLHQTLARTANGRVERFTDLNEELIGRPPDGFAEAPAWRVHFHVPVDADKLGPLSTTRPALSDALRAVRTLDYAPHLEVETYTWEVMPGGGPTNLVEGLTRELIATDRLIAGIDQA